MKKQWSQPQVQEMEIALTQVGSVAPINDPNINNPPPNGDGLGNATNVGKH
ncbi:MAG: hypothetical protein H6Q75_1073 [Firmicutes bacterium]|nr:hypothetical protein [Bacillota bacterium]